MQTIYLDIGNKTALPVLYAKQGDSARQFMAVLTNSGLPYYPADGSIFTVWYSGASGDGNYSAVGEHPAVTVDGYRATVTMTPQMLRNEGKGVMSLILHGADGKQIGLWNIDYVVESIPGAEKAVAEPYFEALLETANSAAKSAAEAKIAAASFSTDKTLSKENKAADAKEVGRSIKELDLSLSRQIAETRSSLVEEISVESARIDNLASLPDGSTSGDAELADLRVDYRGRTWESAGKAVRETAKELAGEIENLVPFVVLVSGDGTCNRTYEEVHEAAGGVNDVLAYLEHERTYLHLAVLDQIGGAISFSGSSYGKNYEFVMLEDGSTGYSEFPFARDDGRMRIGVPLTIKDPKINFDTTAKTITWGVNFFVEYNNANHVITASTISYADVGNIVYFCVNLQSEAVELTAPAGYDPENQVVVFVFVVNGLKTWDYACTLPFPYMVNGQYVRVTESVDIPDGERTVTLNPGEDIQAAVDAGYTTIVLNAGNYTASPVTVRNKNSIRFVVPDAGYDRRKMKKNAVIDNSIDLQVTQGNTLLTATFQAPTESNWYKVFVSKALPPERTGLRSTTYNAILWETDTADNGNDTKLIPVLTMAECEATAGSFFYSHDEGMVYINPLTARDTNVYKRLKVEEGGLLSIVNVHSVYMENIEVKYAPEYLNLNTISDLTAISCIVSHTAYEGGFKVNGVNGVFRDCEAYKVCADGFGIGGDLNGYTEYFNCSGHHCYDDGISHHNGSAGAIYGGVWHHNGKAGVAPAHGAIVNVYNAVAHNNITGFYSKSDATVPEAMGREANYFNCFAYQNKYGIGVKNYHVTTYGCQFRDNDWQDTVIDNESETEFTSLAMI